MTGAPDFREITFHDCSLIGIRRRGQEVLLSLEDVQRQGDMYALELNVLGVTSVSDGDGHPSDLAMETDDGEVLRLTLKSDGTLLLVVEWNKYSPRFQITRTYSLAGDAVRVSVGGMRRMPE